MNNNDKEQDFSPEEWAQFQLDKAALLGECEDLLADNEQAQEEGATAQAEAAEWRNKLALEIEGEEKAEAPKPAYDPPTFDTSPN